MLSVRQVRLLIRAELAKRDSKKTKVHVKYQDDPIGFAVDHLGTLVWEIDEDHRYTLTQLAEELEG